MIEYPKVSIVIATRNRKKYLARMLNKLFDDSYPNLEIIIIDGASTDGTVDLLKSYGAGISKWVSEPDDGEYFAYNKGIDMSSGSILKCMTDDDVLRSGSFHLAAVYFANHPDIDILFGQTAIWQEENDIPNFVSEKIVTDSSQLALRNWIRGTAGVYAPASFIRRNVIDKIGSFSTKYACGDTEYFIRAASKNIKMGLIPEVILDYHYTGENQVVLKRVRIALNMLIITTRYGSFSDLVYVVSKYFELVLRGLMKIKAMSLT